ncbi:MAG TPA: glycosyltransferase family 39 protein [Candidatus Paceibacterota bacterium]|nr:glycosyltransferase family 39 protein [Verrucomicrobiota bacterium]HSA08938.1 glycosyltransferase family 39 protein [Candidatus Paceibacterota bacterium]
MPLLQDLLHKLEVGGGMRFVRVAVVVLGILLLMAGYNWRAFRDMSTQEAMDAAQLARNIAEGKGYTTLFIRPFSMHLVKQRTLEREGPPAIGQVADLSKLKEMHPDLANPPVYPLVLAGLMKLVGFDYTISTTKPFWSNNGRFWRYKPDFFIAVLNQFLLLGAIAMVFFLARRLFDPGVAWLSAALLLGTELLWRFSVSGLSTLLLMVIFLGLVWCVVLLEQEARAPKWGAYGVFVLAGLAGVIVGVGGLTRYSFGWLIAPVMVFLVLFGGARRFALAALALALFAAVMAPWVARNYSVSGCPFGTATYSVVETTMAYPENRLPRSLEPEFSRLHVNAFWYKLNTNMREIVTSELPKLGGSWITALFLAGLMIGFNSPALTRLRYFLLGSLLVLAVTQALGRTHLSEDSPEINSENLLVLLGPLVLVYGVSLFFVLLDQMRLPFLQLRYLVMGVFGLIACLPMLFVFLPPRGTPVAYPPYYPPAIQTVSGWLKDSELIMSDIPWAVAWYGQRQCVWLTLRCTPDTNDPNVHEDFFAINDYQKPIKLLYLTPRTMDARFLTQWIRAGEQSWGSFILESMVKKKVPTYFPLTESQAGWLPEQLVLTDWQRWRKQP